MPLIRRSFFWFLSGALAFAAATAAAAVDERPGPPVPDAQDLIDLVRETVLAVDAGNHSGDYGRLHAMGAPGFQAANPPERLAAGFERLRAQKLDLSPVSEKTPMTSRAPTLDRNGLLRILGFFEIGQIQLVYDLLYDYDPDGRRWRLAAISLTPRDIAPQPELMQPQ